MEQVANGKSRVRCPGCGRVFEFDEDNRGFATRCPKCEAEFMIPDEGMDGIPLKERPDDGTFDINCPKCNTLFVLAQEYRGEIADCAECHSIFQIPQTGSVGVLVEDDGAAAEARFDEPEMQAAETSLDDMGALRRTATVFLSRKEVLDSAAQHERGAAGTPPGTSGIRGGGDSTDDEQYGLVDGPELRGAFELNTDPVFEPAHALGVRRSDLPEWLPPIGFEKREKIVEFEEGAVPPQVLHRLVTFLPLLLIPLAGWLGSVVHPAMAGASCFLAGLACWGLYVAKLLPPLSRKVIVLTNYRAIMADPHEVVDIDLV